MRRSEIRTAKLQREADSWNTKHPVGTLVRYWTGLREGKPSGIGPVRWAAQPMSDHVSAWVEGCVGSVCVSHVEAVDPDLAADLLDAHAALATERERAEAAERALATLAKAAREYLATRDAFAVGSLTNADIARLMPLNAANRARLDAALAGCP